MSFDFEGRWATAAALMRAHGIDAMFLMKPTNLAYLTGDGRPCALGLLTSTGRFIVAVPECDLASVRAASRRKDAQEIELLRHAAQVADVGMDAAVNAVRVGTSETLVAAEAEYAMRKAGAEGWAAPTYVASGWRSAMAHGPASSKTIGTGEVVQVHVAPVIDGYTVDLCRTILPGDASSEASADLEVYLEAQQAGITAAAPGAPLLGIDAAMANVLETRGYADRFLRPTFHGVGMEHEEAPIPGGHAVIHGEEQVEEVQAGMVLAIGNCGIYRENYGVRAEDTIWISPDGPIELTRYPKNPRTH
jgi:Xaa-Pro dipeptidase